MSDHDERHEDEEFPKIEILSIAEAVSMLAASNGPTDTVNDLLDVFQVFEDQDNQFVWATDEINKACDRHGETDEDGPIHAAAEALFVPPVEGMEQEIVYRAHARELLDRIAAGQDLVPATDAELVCAIKYASTQAPLNDGARTLYTRLIKRTFPSVYEKLGPKADAALAASEAVHGAEADQRDAYGREHMAMHDRAPYNRK